MSIETRNKKQETRNKKQETRNKKQETRNKKQIAITKSYVNILFVGNIRQQNQGLVGSVYYYLGVSPTLRARDYKDPLLILIEK